MSLHYTVIPPWRARSPRPRATRYFPLQGGVAMTTNRFKMQNSRQAIADLPLRQGRWLRRTSALFRYVARKAAYSYPYVRSVLERPSPSTTETANSWDYRLSQTNQSTYLGHTITVDTS